MVVEKQMHKTLLVNIIGDRLVIYHQVSIDNGLEKIYDEPTDKFRAVLFLYCTDCRIFVMSKVLKLTLIQCAQCQISIRGGVIGLVEIFRCIDTNIDIRSQFSLLMLELCSNVHMYQRIEELVYGVIGGSNCTIKTVDPENGVRLNSYSVEDLFGDRRFYHLSCTGMRWVDEPYILNNITLHLMALPPESKEDSDPFGKTPPVVGFFNYQLDSRKNKYCFGVHRCNFEN